MNKVERIRLVKSMEYIARQLNDEDILMYWLMDGVPDGDIEYGDLSDEEVGIMDFLIQDEQFSGLIHTFLRAMSKARRTDSGLYCDGICRS